MNATGTPATAMTTDPTPGIPGVANGIHTHDACWVCGAVQPEGLHLSFRADADGSVLTRFDCPERYAVYAGVLHGGMVATLLDAAMTHCLFARNETGMTADLQVRFRSAVRVGIPATIRAWQVRSRGSMEEVCAELWQEGQLCAAGRGKFIRARATRSNHTRRPGPHEPYRAACLDSPVPRVSELNPTHP
jgi:acyl-coenzyme A thioesterase PaaI-like protein